jgi:hypothetical protein
MVEIYPSKIVKMKNLLILGILFLSLFQGIKSQDTISKVIILLPEPIYIYSKGMKAFNSSKTTICNPPYVIRDIEDQNLFQNCNFQNYFSKFNCKDFYLFVEIEVANLLIDKDFNLSQARSDSLEKLLKFANRAFRNFRSTRDTSSIIIKSFESFFNTCLQSGYFNSDLKKAYSDYLEMKNTSKQVLVENQFNLFIGETGKKSPVIILNSGLYKLKIVPTKKKFDKLKIKHKLELIEINDVNFYKNKSKSVVYVLAM